MCTYGNCSKISNISCLLKGLKQGRPRSDCFLKKQSDQSYPHLLVCQAICEFKPQLSSFYLRTEREKCLKFKNIYCISVLKEQPIDVYLEGHGSPN